MLAETLVDHVVYAVRLCRRPHHDVQPLLRRGVEEIVPERRHVRSRMDRAKARKEVPVSVALPVVLPSRMISALRPEVMGRTVEESAVEIEHEQFSRQWGVFDSGRILFSQCEVARGRCLRWRRRHGARIVAHHSWCRARRWPGRIRGTRTRLTSCAPVMAVVPRAFLTSMIYAP